MRRALIYGALAVSLFLIVFHASRDATFRARLAYAQGTVSPFQAETWVYSYKNSPVGEVVLKEISAVDGSGSVAKISSMRKAPDRMVVRKVERVDGLSARVVDDLKLVSSFHVDNGKLRRRALQAQAGCITPDRRQRALGTEQVLGFDAVVLQSSSPKKVRITEWLVPKLGCFAIRRTSERLEDDGSFRIVSEYRTVKVDTGEPPRSLFEVPSDYTEVKPSEMWGRFSAYMGDQLSQPPEKLWERQDKEYQALRSK